jgi:guanylate kinase
VTTSFPIFREPLLVVVSGPSGVGKSTVVDRVLARVPGFVASVSVTTRPPRGSERDGFEYFFVTREEFERRRAAGDFLEWAEVHGNLYGTPSAFVESKLAAGTGVILEIDVQGGGSVRSRFPDAVLIFLVPPGIDTLRRRLEGRGTDDEAVILQRLENAKRELARYDRYNYLVVNDDVDRCAEDCVAIIRAEGLRRERTSLA